MGQKVSPRSFRLGPSLIGNWDSIFYSDRQYAAWFLEDVKVRAMVFASYKENVSRVVIQRSGDDVYTVNIHAKRGGAIISDIENLTKKIKKIVSSKDVRINVHEVKRPESDAKILAVSLASQIEKRVAYKRAMKAVMASALRQPNVLGIKIGISGRLNGTDIARSEWIKEGKVPLHTLKADIDYATALAHTGTGIICIKIWVNKSDTSRRARFN
ncbi:30S ribosomal protein S3 [Rickettsiales endosymbiont of Paramecium tredecaurelia]|uniref:30S ribosomal protein S3 n=1 Tax=Candidatus Sarmatiella mevalonica TaxID=2770581 RepID=UPI001920B595|nr:30S ribosomal protein S3 [Candidatus Sarmatiella mevalonica]MBL3284573.1 30S ribosomal protein S3 [Candidatus Sarmatiella mevalonica]